MHLGLQSGLCLHCCTLHLHHLAMNRNLQVAQSQCNERRRVRCMKVGLQMTAENMSGSLLCTENAAMHCTSLLHRAKKRSVLYPKYRFQKLWRCHPNSWLGDPQSDSQSCRNTVCAAKQSHHADAGYRSARTQTFQVNVGRRFSSD